MGKINYFVQTLSLCEGGRLSSTFDNNEDPMIKVYCAIGTAIIFPAVLLWLFQVSSSAALPRTRLLVILSAWLSVLVFACVAQHFNEKQWFATNASRSLSEEDMMSLGDSPNVLAAWLLFGWLPVLIGYILVSFGSNKALHPTFNRP